MLRNILLSTAFVFFFSANGGVSADHQSDLKPDELSNHMIAEAMLTALFIDTALGAGMTREQINDALTWVAGNSAISEFWISDENGNVEFTNFPGVNFKFPLDPNAASQAAPFADLILGNENVVVQDFQSRELDQKLYKYVGVSGIDKPRIVQVGVAKPD